MSPSALFSQATSGILHSVLEVGLKRDVNKTDQGGLG